MRTGALILAAGRFGASKQLLEIGGETVICENTAWDIDSPEAWTAFQSRDQAE